MRRLSWRKWGTWFARAEARVARYVRRGYRTLAGEAASFARSQDSARWGLTAVLALVALGALDRASRRPDPELFQPATGSPIAAPAKNLPVGDWSYFRPAWTGRALPTRHPEHPDVPTDVSRLVGDPGNRLETEFKVPDYLRDRVVFWMHIHAVFNGKMRVVHDRENPGLIYGFLDLRPIYRNASTVAGGDAQAYRIERAVVKGIKARLSEAAGLTRTALLSDDEKAALRGLLSRAGALGAEDASRLIARVRTQTGQSDEFLKALQRSRLLLPHIESVLRRHGLPIALARIPFVESSFNARALSKVGAVGIWQFMPETARQMISSTDQKLWADPLRQTVAAARMLRIIRSLLPDWSTTVTAYNSGVGRLRRLAQKERATSLEGILKTGQADGLGFAGENFYAQFLSVNLIEAYKEELFQKLLEPADAALVFHGPNPFPADSCSL